MRLALVLGFLFYFVALLMQNQGCNGCLEKERIGLLEIKAYFLSQKGAHPDTNSELASWVDDRASNCCAWNRVKCSNLSTGHVTDLSLHWLARKLTPGGRTSFGQLSLGTESNVAQDNWPSNWMFNVSIIRPFEELHSLDLSGNLYLGWIGNEGFPRLKKLETLDLSGNRLNSSILPSLNGLTSLRTLNLRYNWMNEYFSAQGFSRLKKLEVLDLSENLLNCSISLLGFTSLRSLELAQNKFDCSFSTLDFANFSRLELLDLSNNELTGSLRVEDVQNLRNLKMLDSSFNQMNGSVEGKDRNKHILSLYMSILGWSKWRP